MKAKDIALIAFIILVAVFVIYNLVAMYSTSEAPQANAKSVCVLQADSSMHSLADSSSPVVDTLATGEQAIRTGPAVNGWQTVTSSRLVQGYILAENCK